MSTTIAAPYAETHKELQDVIIKAKQLPDDQVKQGLGVLAAQLSNAAAQKAIGDEIKDLGIRAVTLEKAFSAVYTLLPQSDSEIPHVDNLLQGWKALHETYKQLLVKSGEVAGQGHDVANSFATQLMHSLADAKVPATEKASSIDNYNKLIEQNSQNAHGLSQGFEQLQQDVAKFVKEWPTWNSENVALSQVDSEIQALQNTVIDFLTKVSNLQLTFTYGDIHHGSGVTSILGAIIPSFWTGALATAIGPLMDQEVLSKVKSEDAALNPALIAARTARNQAEASLTPAQQLQAHLLDIPTDLEGVIKPLRALTSIWDAIRSDLGVIQQTMAGSAQHPETMQLLLPRLQVFGGLYGMVAAAFAGYQSIVNAAVPASESK